MTLSVILTGTIAGNCIKRSDNPYALQTEKKKEQKEIW